MVRPNQNNNTGNRRASPNHGRSKDVQKRKLVEEKQWSKTKKKTSTKEFVQQIPVLGQGRSIGRKGTNTADTVATTNRPVTRNNTTSTANTTNDDENVCMICFVFVLITSQ